MNLLTLKGHWDTVSRTDLEAATRIRNFINITKLPEPWQAWAIYDRAGMKMHRLPVMHWPSDDIDSACKALVSRTISDPSGKRTFTSGLTSRFISYIEDATDPVDLSWTLNVNDGIGSPGSRNRMTLSPPISLDYGQEHIGILVDTLYKAIDFWDPILMHIGDVAFTKSHVPKFVASKLRVEWMNYYRKDLLENQGADLSRLPSDINVSELSKGFVVTLPGNPVEPSYEAAVHVRRSLNLPTYGFN